MVKEGLAVARPARKDVGILVIHELHGVRAVSIHHPDAFLLNALAVGKVGDTAAVGRVSWSEFAASGIGGKPLQPASPRIERYLGKIDIRPVARKDYPFPIGREIQLRVVALPGRDLFPLPPG